LVSSSAPTDLLKQIKVKGPAPVHLWDPPFCGDMDLRIARDGCWYHEGSLIQRKAMVELFSSILKRESDGEFYLVTPVEKVRIQVEDCPFVALGADIKGQGGNRQISFITNTKESFIADSNHKISVTEAPDTGQPHPIVHVRNGLDALIHRNVYYQLVAAAEYRDQGNTQIAGISSAGIFFELGRFPTDNG